MVRDKNGRVYTEYLRQIVGLGSVDAERYRDWVRAFVRGRYEKKWGRTKGLEGYTREISLRSAPYRVKEAGEAVRYYWYWNDEGSDSTGQVNWERNGSGRRDCLSPTARKVIEEAREVMRLQHKSYRTEQSYIGWIRRFLCRYNATPIEKLEGSASRRSSSR